MAAATICTSTTDRISPRPSSSSSRSTGPPQVPPASSFLCSTSTGTRGSAIRCRSRGFGRSRTSATCGRATWRSRRSFPIGPRLTASRMKASKIFVRKPRKCWTGTSRRRSCSNSVQAGGRDRWVRLNPAMPSRREIGRVLACSGKYLVPLAKRIIF